LNDSNARIIAELRASGGKAAQFGDAPLVDPPQLGAKSGELRAQFDLVHSWASTSCRQQPV